MFKILDKIFVCKYNFKISLVIVCKFYISNYISNLNKIY